jgi:uncharacterized membrane protein YhaH (DUF805 family)
VTDRKLTTAPEVACYLGAHIIGIAVSIFWSPFLSSYVRQFYGSNAASSVAVANAVVLILAVMFLFLFGRMVLARESLPQGGRLTTASEVGTYLFAHLIGITIGVAWSPIFYMFVRDIHGAVLGGVNLLLLANALVIIVIVMFLFFAVRLLPRFTRVWFEFHGRCSRFDYWVVYLVALYAVLGVLALGVLAVQSWVPFVALTSLWLWEPFLFWPGLAVGVKRCHDRDHSGWFLLVGLIPIIGSIWLLIELGFLRGTIGPNRFGPDPVPGGMAQPAMAAQAAQ